VRHKAAIHSGHFMVSDFEPDEQDEEDTSVPPEEGSNLPKLIIPDAEEEEAAAAAEAEAAKAMAPIRKPKRRNNQPSGNMIKFSLPESNNKEVSLTSLFKSMSHAYRQKLTSPKWNRFRGLKLRWKDKIRMNNVIWRCWHMQFLKNEPRPLCAFANPLDIDNHNRTEGSTVLEGKYWKRKLETIQKEYHYWRRTYQGQNTTEAKEEANQRGIVYDASASEWDSFLRSPGFQMVEGTRDDVDLQSMLNDEGMIVDLLLNTIQESTMASSEISSLLGTSSTSYETSMSVAVPFPNTRDYYKHTTNADLMQPGLGSLQPNIEDVDLDFDWLGLQFGSTTSVSNGTFGHSKNTTKNVDLLSAVVTATTASLTTSQMDQQEQHQLQQRQPDLKPAYSLPSSHYANPQRPPHQVGGKPHSMYQHNGGLPYPLPHDGPTTSVNGSDHKLRSPKHRFLQHRDAQSPQDPYRRYGMGRPAAAAAATATRSYATKSLSTITSQTVSSELVQLLKTPKVERSINISMSPHVPNPYNGIEMNSIPTDLSSRRPTPTILNHQPVVCHLALGIPPPLATDYQQVTSGRDNYLSSSPRRVNYRGLTNTQQYAEHRRSVHINAEQSRRTSIKHGFEELRALIPCLRDVPASSHKISKAALLHKGGDHIRQLRADRQAMEKEATQLKAKIEDLETEVSSLQGSLPVSGGSSSISGKLRQHKVTEDSIRLDAMFDDHVCEGTDVNWKYWAFSRLMRPLFDTFVEAVAGTAQYAEMERATNHWLEDKCSLMQIRQSALTSLKMVSVTTNILSEPHRMPQEVIELARNPPRHRTSEKKP
jgi:hypothetical protein